MAYHRTKTPNTRTIITTIVVEFIGFLIVSYPLIHTYVSLKGKFVVLSLVYFRSGYLITLCKINIVKWKIYL